MKNLSRSNRILMWLGIGLVGAVIVAAFAGNSVTTFDANTPEGVVQRYIGATIDDDDKTADGYLVDSDSCESDMGLDLYGRGSDNHRIALRDSSIDGDEAQVRISVTEGDAGAFDSYSYTHDERFDLIRVDSQWKIKNQTWPRYGC